MSKIVRMEVIKVNERNEGILVDDGEQRTISIMVEVMSGASESENNELMEEIKNVYAKYRCRVFQKMIK